MYQVTFYIVKTPLGGPVELHAVSTKYKGTATMGRHTAELLHKKRGTLVFEHKGAPGVTLQENLASYVEVYSPAQCLAAFAPHFVKAKSSEIG